MSDKMEFRTGNDRRLSDLVAEETAKEIALKHIPNTFKWERNSTDSDMIMQWVIDAMREYELLSRLNNE